MSLHTCINLTNDITALWSTTVLRSIFIKPNTIHMPHSKDTHLYYVNMYIYIFQYFTQLCHIERSFTATYRKTFTSIKLLCIGSGWPLYEGSRKSIRAEHAKSCSAPYPFLGHVQDTVTNETSFISSLPFQNRCYKAIPRPTMKHFCIKYNYTLFSSTERALSILHYSAPERTL